MSGDASQVRSSRFFYDRGVRLAAGLAVVVAIPMAVLFYFQFKSLHDIETTSAVVLRQLSSETADSLTRAIEDYMKRPHISVLLRIPAGPDRAARPAIHRTDFQRRARSKARSSSRSSCGPRVGPQVEQVAGVRSGEPGAAERRG